jgi:hypothetical protein
MRARRSGRIGCDKGVVGDSLSISCRLVSFAERSEFIHQSYHEENVVMEGDWPAREGMEVTEEMIAAGASVIWAREDIDIGPTGCEHLARAILRAGLRALSQRRAP